MAKEPPVTKPDNDTPFQRFQRLAKRLVSVPKDESHKSDDKGSSSESTS